MWLHATQEEKPLSYWKRRLGGFSEMENFKVQLTVGWMRSIVPELFFYSWAFCCSLLIPRVLQTWVFCLHIACSMLLYLKWHLPLINFCQSKMKNYFFLSSACHCDSSFLFHLYPFETKKAQQNNITYLPVKLFHATKLMSKLRF